jgi:crossover junction endodeoxyribonuclease RuvC
MRILGLDPGLRHTGWGVVEAHGSRLRFLAAGAVHSDLRETLPARLDQIYRGLSDVIERWRPDEVAVEQTVVNRNAGSSLKLGHARGVVLLAAAHGAAIVAEYGSMEVKRAVTGTGHAEKVQVAMMVKVLLPGCDAAGGDATDALAVAVCHAHHAQSRRALAAAVS